jgi:hypothetical protein
LIPSNRARLEPAAKHPIYLAGAFLAPLRFIGVLGGLTIVSAFGYGVYAVLARFAWGHSPAGFTALAVMLATIGGMILLSLWIIGEYVGRIYDEVKRRPVYVIDKIVNG